MSRWQSQRRATSSMEGKVIRPPLEAMEVTPVPASLKVNKIIAFSPPLIALFFAESQLC